jgi:hypothetical protein
VTTRTERNPILQGIIPQLAPSSQMMHLHVYGGPATLAPPTISSQPLIAELFVVFGIKLKSGLFGARSIRSVSAERPLGSDPLEDLLRPENLCRSFPGSKPRDLSGVIFGFLGDDLLPKTKLNCNTQLAAVPFEVSRSTELRFADWKPPSTFLAKYENSLLS